MRRKDEIAIPDGAILVSCRYDALENALEEIPACSCCLDPYKTVLVRGFEGKQYARLEPSCTCLDQPEIVSPCCGRCSTHCRCKTLESREAAGRVQ